MGKLTIEDCNSILTSLEFTKKAIREYTGYPSYEFKSQRLAEISVIKQKIQMMRVELKRENDEN